MPVIGVLALQGAFREHIAAFSALGSDITAVEVRTPAELAACDGLVIPGGESTAMALIAQRTGMWEPLKSWVHEGRPTWGTCAGMIMMADRVSGAGTGQSFIGGLDVDVARNFFGSQVASTVTVMDLAPALRSELALNDPPGTLETEGEPCGVFIRAPAFTSVGPRATPLAWVSLPGASSATGTVTPVTTLPPPVCVAARQGLLLATAFHPELTAQRSFHRLFLRMVVDAASKGSAAIASPGIHGLQTSHGQMLRGSLADIPLPAALLPTVAHKSLASSVDRAALAVTPGSSTASSYSSQHKWTHEHSPFQNLPVAGATAAVTK